MVPPVIGSGFVRHAGKSRQDGPPVSKRFRKIVGPLHGTGIRAQGSILHGIAPPAGSLESCLRTNNRLLSSLLARELDRTATAFPRKCGKSG